MTPDPRQNSLYRRLLVDGSLFLTKRLIGSIQITEGRWLACAQSPQAMTRAQNILKAALHFQVGDDQRIHWKGVVGDLDTIVRCSDILAESRSRFGTYVDYIFLQKPTIMPELLPPQWRSKREPDWPGPEAAANATFEWVK